MKRFYRGIGVNGPFNGVMGAIWASSGSPFTGHVGFLGVLGLWELFRDYGSLERVVEGVWELCRGCGMPLKGL